MDRWTKLWGEWTPPPYRHVHQRLHAVRGGFHQRPGAVYSHTSTRFRSQLKGLTEGKYVLFIGCGPNEWTNGPMNGPNEWTNGPMDQWTNEWTK